MSWQYLLLHLLGEGLIEEREAGEILESMKDQFASLRKRYIRKIYAQQLGCPSDGIHMQRVPVVSRIFTFRRNRGLGLEGTGTSDWASGAG